MLEVKTIGYYKPITVKWFFVAVSYNFARVFFQIGACVLSLIPRTRTK